MSCSTVPATIQDMSEVLCNTLSPAFMPHPSVSDWRKIVAGHKGLWHVPHCLGAVDAKLLEVSHKNENDIVLMASCDAKLNFTIINDENYCSLEGVTVCAPKRQVPRDWLSSTQQLLSGCPATVELRESLKSILSR
ncbi:uncharacterized protein LOC116803864 [Drosophila mojavensis]|uniref:uncharacterized protein LOC116803864 n=1 Tax=Drosophila mojavensis TaxID=7230 RepID=UPI0013EEB505|nr:uncharacterized protein LOC116803864 [Drosophila mojavensis]